MSDPFATAAELSQFIGIAEPTDLSRMQSFVAAASAVIRRYSGQTLSQVVDDVVVIQPQSSLTTGQLYPLPNAAYYEKLLLPQRPVTAISSIVVNAATLSSSVYGFTPNGIVYRTDGLGWLYAATVTYTHGFPESSDDYAAIKNICLEAASAAYTLNQNQGTQFLGPTTAETAGYAPMVFLTEGQKAQLQFGRAYVG